MAFPWWAGGSGIHGSQVTGKQVTTPQCEPCSRRTQEPWAHGGEAHWPAWGMKELGDESVSWEQGTVCAKAWRRSLSGSRIRGTEQSQDWQRERNQGIAASRVGPGDWSCRLS